jgi:DNA excision repair protein ERCC-2
MSDFTANNLSEPADSVAPVQPEPVFRIAVRTLAETVHRRGGLAGPEYGGVAPADGTRLHQRFFRILSERHDANAVATEVALSTTCQLADWTLQIGGRCDALVDLPEGPLLIEAKSFTGHAEQLPPDGETVHWAQARLYAWLYLATRPELSAIRIGLAYLSLESSTAVEFSQTATRQEMADFFAETCRVYAEFNGNQLRSLRFRSLSGRECHFPYPSLRAGQKRFMQEVIGAARQKSSVFIQAPTGIGKTMAALYPAVKIIANHLTDHVFYLTAMTSTRLVAAQALDDLRRTGLHMKYLILFAKEKLCLAPELYCDSRVCPFATAYYDHLPDALRQMFLLESISRDEILACARQHQVCPFELSLDLALYCEIIICDYNYAFDPRVRLERFFGQDLPSWLLLVDEAHNLPARSREMFSAQIDSGTLAAAQAAVKDRSPFLEQTLERLRQYLAQLLESLRSDEPGFDRVEKAIPGNAVMIAADFRALRELPASLLGLLGRFSFACREFLDRNLDFPQRRALLDFYFSVLFFQRVAEEYHDQTYVTTAKRLDDRLEIQLMCLDAAEKLALTYRDKHAAVFFSATLSPMVYYMGLLSGDSRRSQPESLLLPSPFPSENLLVLVCSQLSTRFRQRQDTVQAILQLILTAIRQKTGNYLVFVPSFAYLSMLRNLVRTMAGQREMDRQSTTDWMFQLPEMNESLRRKFLRRFEKFGERTLVAVAVIGGVFAESIDLVGEKLAGVTIVGVGLPQICPEREIMKQYFAQTLGSGYEYAYLYPGFNKVQQAAGRVIRSENDRGFVLLIDDRYGTPAYTELFPAEWQPVAVQDQAELAAVLQDFWAQSAPTS